MIVTFYCPICGCSEPGEVDECSGLDPGDTIESVCDTCADSEAYQQYLDDLEDQHHYLMSMLF